MRTPAATWNRTIAAFCLWTIALSGTAATAQVRKVGEEASYSLRSESPYPGAADGEWQRWVVEHPGATYIRLHFADFELAPGDELVVSNPAGTERHAYEGRGPHGNGSFWAFAVLGQTAVLELRARTGAGRGFEVDAYGHGVEPIGPGPGEPVEPLSVCGQLDWRDVECYATTRPVEYDRARAVALALIGCCNACTSFKVSDDGRFLTNNHCFNNTAAAQSTELRFYYQNNVCGGGGTGLAGSVMGDSVLATDFGLDYTLFTTTGDSDGIPCVQLDPRLPREGEPIYIAHHPGGGVKKISVDSDQNAGGSCEVDNAPHNGNFAGSDIGYLCDTTNGSSGSPVFSGLTHGVIGLHHFGGCLNSGGRIDLIHPQISSLLGTCSDGGMTECGNGVIEPEEQCEGSDVGDADCADVGCSGGLPSCSDNCKIDYDTCAGCSVCDDDGTCEAGEDCLDCPGDCDTVSGSAACGNDVCEIADGEDCLSCPQDCNGRSNGSPSGRYCCGNDVGCGDSRCEDAVHGCSDVPAGSTCCGDGSCEGGEDSFGCEIDCGPPPCGDLLCDPGAGEDACSCPDDCGAAWPNETSCTNGSDDDCDGDVDCDDADCAADSACVCLPPGASCEQDSECCSDKCKGPSGNRTCR